MNNNSNADYIRSLNNEELAKFFSTFICRTCTGCPIRQFCDREATSSTCYEVWEEWLKQKKEKVK